jgi:hypothetical protein
VHNSRKYIIEFDGKQHFKYYEYFHESDDDFKFNQEIDRIKTYVTCEINNIKMIRIDFNNKTEDDIRQHIINAINSDSLAYYSNPELYQYISQPVNQELLDKECPSLKN